MLMCQILGNDGGIIANVGIIKTHILSYSSQIFKFDKITRLKPMHNGLRVEIEGIWNVYK